MLQNNLKRFSNKFTSNHDISLFVFSLFHSRYQWMNPPPVQTTLPPRPPAQTPRPLVQAALPPHLPPTPLPPPCWRCRCLLPSQTRSASCYRTFTQTALSLWGAGLGVAAHREVEVLLLTKELETVGCSLSWRSTGWHCR